jgi:predicted tellurium resistance membrane protein TerC
VTLSLLEIVLGIDNVIFISIVANRLSGEARMRARFIGLALALIMRVFFLATIVWLTGMVATVYTFRDIDLSWRDIILISGGLFLLIKATLEIHAEMENKAHNSQPSLGVAAVGWVIVQIVLLDLVLSVDSIITAVGMSRELPVMIAAVVVAILVMLLASGPVGDFIHRHPTVKMLALAFLLLIGVALIADGLDFHIPREYLYAAIAFSLFVEFLNIMARKNRTTDDTG